jgi:hypothetical protein
MALFQRAAAALSALLVQIAAIAFVILAERSGTSSDELQIEPMFIQAIHMPALKTPVVVQRSKLAPEAP